MRSFNIMGSHVSSYLARKEKACVCGELPLALGVRLDGQEIAAAIFARDVAAGGIAGTGAAFMLALQAFTAYAERLEELPLGRQVGPRWLSQVACG